MTTSHLATFQRLHAGPDVLVLANVWDGLTAQLVARAGAAAIATTSAAVAWANGYPDGEALPLPRLLATVEAIRRVTDLPLSVDAESGYSPDPERAAATVARLVDAGAVGVNLEDGTLPPDVLAAKLTRIKARAAVFVNARTDVYLRGLGEPATRTAEVIRRGRQYRDAGADGFFVPGLTDAAELRAIADAVPLPLNALARPGLPPRAELAALGVRRLSAGSGLAQVLWPRVDALVAAFLATGDSSALLTGATPHAAINPLFATLAAHAGS